MIGVVFHEIFKSRYDVSSMRHYDLSSMRHQQGFLLNPWKVAQAKSPPDYDFVFSSP